MRRSQRIIISHLDGALPMLMQRIDNQYEDGLGEDAAQYSTATPPTCSACDARARGRRSPVPVLARLCRRTLGLASP